MTLAYPSDARVVRFVRLVSRGLIILVLCRSAIILLGWILGIDALKNLLNPESSTRFLPPFLNLLASAALLLLANARRSNLTPKASLDFTRWDFTRWDFARWDFHRLIPRAFGTIVFCFALLTIGEYFFGLNLGIHELYFAEQLNGVSGELNGGMSPNGAIGFSFLGLAILLLTFRVSWVRTAQALALGACAIAMLALIGHAYGVNHLYAFTGLASMKLLGAVWFLMLSISAFIVLPEEGMMRLLTSSLAGGVMARRLFLAILVIPPALGVISLGGFKDLLYDTAFSISLLVILSMIIFGGISAALSTQLEAADTRKRDAERQLSTSREELRDLSAHVQALQEEERIRIAREIHDELGQSLTAIKMDVSLLKRSVDEDDKISPERLDGILRLVNSTIHSVQRIATELRPGVLDDLGLTAALEWQTQEFQLRTGILSTLTVRPPEVTTDQKRSTALFRIFQETLTNVARHAHARRVTILLEQVDHTIRLRISDDGLGIDANLLTRGESLGLIGMRERAHLLGGTIEITGVPNGGTTVEVNIPLDQEVVIV